VDHDDPKDDLRGRLIEYEDLIRSEQLNPSDADGTRESDLEDMREVLLARAVEASASGRRNGGASPDGRVVCEGPIACPRS